MIILFIALLCGRSFSFLLGFGQQLPKFILSPVSLFLTSQLYTGEPVSLANWALLFLFSICFFIHSHCPEHIVPASTAHAFSLSGLYLPVKILPVLPNDVNDLPICISQVDLCNK